MWTSGHNAARAVSKEAVREEDNRMPRKMTGTRPEGQVDQDPVVNPYNGGIPKDNTLRCLNTPRVHQNLSSNDR